MISGGMISFFYLKKPLPNISRKKCQILLTFRIQLITTILHIYTTTTTTSAFDIN